MRALIIVDIQNDFLKGGSLEVPKGNEVISIINKLQLDYDLVVATQDWHPYNHKSFASQHEGENVFDEIILDSLSQTLWPDHCVQGSFGADFSPELDQNKIEVVFRKGMDEKIDSYSGFYDNGKLKSTGLLAYLKGKGIKEVDVCGLAADYCVYFTAVDALETGFRTRIIEEATRAISPENFVRLKADFQKMGGEII